MDKGSATAASVALLLLSSSVMVVAWYLHLRFESWPTWKAVLFSWLIASVEYCAQVPANRLGVHHAGLSPAAMRAVAEVCVLTAFLAFNTGVLRRSLTLNHVVGFAIVLVGVLVVLFGPLDYPLIKGTDTQHTRRMAEGGIDLGRTQAGDASHASQYGEQALRVQARKGNDVGMIARQIFASAYALFDREAWCTSMEDVVLMRWPCQPAAGRGTGGCLWFCCSLD